MISIWSVWDSWEIKEISFVIFFPVDTQKRSRFLLYFLHTSWLVVSKLVNIFSEFFPASQFMACNVFSFIAYKKSLSVGSSFFWRWLTYLLILILDLVICLAACLGLAKQSRWLLTTWVQTYITLINTGIKDIFVWVIFCGQMGLISLIFWSSL